MMEPVDYSSSRVPVEYKCSACGVHGGKLWRQYQTFADHIELLCVDCGGKDQKKDVADVDEKGRILSDSEYDPGRRLDQIGWLVPAVPTEEGDTYWGYSSVPKAGVEWWWRLPSRKVRVSC